MKQLNCWSVVGDKLDVYKAPEQRSFCLVGKLDSGAMIKTSMIVKAEGKVITTRSGSLYVLGEIDPNYLKFIKDNNISYNKDNPIVIRDA